MQKKLAEKLQQEAKDLADKFSDPNRAGNVNKETFEVAGIVPKSDHVASVSYLKSTGKLAHAVALWNPGFDRWEIRFFTDSHYMGLVNMYDDKRTIESHNFDKNF